MKKNNLIKIIAFMLVLCALLTSCGKSEKNDSKKADIKPFTGKALNYKDSENWMEFYPEGKRYFDTDVIFFYPTCVSPDCKETVSNVDKYMKNAAKASYLESIYGFIDFANVFVPYYRQISPEGMKNAESADDIYDLCSSLEPRTDVYAALDYYFKEVNRGRPFILAGYSQGACMLKMVLSEYMKAHPDYFDLMVACYAPGFYFPDSWFKENPQVKKAKSATDYDVFISWNLEGEGAKKDNIVVGDGSYNINPLNWKTDETKAENIDNLGSIFVDKKTLEQSYLQGMSDARIDLKRGVLVSSNNTDYVDDTAMFGDKSLHYNDWSLFFENIRQNAMTRISSFMAERSEELESQ